MCVLYWYLLFLKNAVQPPLRSFVMSFSRSIKYSNMYINIVPVFMPQYIIFYIQKRTTDTTSLAVLKFDIADHWFPYWPHENVKKNRKVIKAIITMTLSTKFWRSFGRLLLRSNRNELLSECPKQRIANVTI